MFIFQGPAHSKVSVYVYLKWFIKLDKERMRSDVAGEGKPRCQDGGLGGVTKH